MNGIKRRGAILIQDNAFCHKDGNVWGWFGENGHWLEVHQLPAYSPELNPTERLWQYIRRTGTHNRYFSELAELVGTLACVFGEMQHYPELIRPYLQSFWQIQCVPLFMRSSTFDPSLFPPWAISFRPR